MSLLRNPEFLRHVWLELTPQRLLATPLILGLIVLIVSQVEIASLGLPTVSMGLFVGMTALWGAKLASDSLNNELTQGTWDNQRLSGMGAWQMTLGKLAGGPVFAWYGGALSLVVFALTTPWNWASLRMLLTALAVAISLHALALLSALLAWRKQPRSTATPRSRGASILLLIVFGPQVFFMLPGDEPAGNVHWYAWHIPAPEFLLACVLLAMFWATLGLYRVMREELSFRDPPNAWIAFLLFLFVFGGGWFHGGQTSRIFEDLGPVAAHLATCLLICLVANYGLLFSERKDWVRMRRLVALWRDGQRSRAWELTPKWLATFALSAGVVATFVVACLITEPPMRAIAAACTAAGFLLFLVRDAALVLGLNFARDQSRADSAAAVYLVVLYALLPGLFVAIGLQFLAAVFWPPLLFAQPPWLILMVVQVAVALDFAIKRWRKLPA
ncbi:hypothetical protein DFR24_2969 [Panacagrimonas perspica]|uniref:Uncharacterized protein n=1 Tax=Panacagrimonas perspica TaxID=381431 RepID=A0A4R7P4A0_9GAMM|nr:hypothetical protein [Panacagrimonas perspica]TDU28594.1 hypothetical protein DFR24_2969 [Panacagrimonas perspica]THD04929.1 hypothetical protein B1810_02985 [Panacagrimonas perspica]